MLFAFFFVCTVAVSCSPAGSRTQWEEGRDRAMLPELTANLNYWAFFFFFFSFFLCVLFFFFFWYFSTLRQTEKILAHANLTTLLRRLLFFPPSASRIIKRETCKGNIPSSKLVLQRAGKMNFFSFFFPSPSFLFLFWSWKLCISNAVISVVPLLWRVRM